MNIELKLTGTLYEQIINDLARPHPFAAERIGFVFGRTGELDDENKLVLLTRYHSIPDDQYIDDASVGACIGTDAITEATQAVYYGRPKREGIYHVHMHGHYGRTGMSKVDADDIPRLIPGFRSVGKGAAHGIIIMSFDHGTAWIWMPGQESPAVAANLSVIGTPVKNFRTQVMK